MKKNSFIKGLASISGGFLIAYSILVRFGGFYDQSAWKKLVLLLVFGTGLAVANFVYFFSFFRKNSSLLNRRQKLNFSFFLLFFTLLFFSLFYRPVPIYELHSLEIVLKDVKNEASQGYTVEIIDIIQNKKIAHLEEILELNGNWQTTEYPLFGIGSGTSLKHSWEGRGGGEIRFRASPISGMINLYWEGGVQEIDLYSPEYVTKIIPLEDTVRGTARIMWRVLGTVAFIADGVLIICLLAGFLLLLINKKLSMFWLASFMVFVSMIYSTSLHLFPLAGSENTLRSNFKVRDADNRLSEGLGGDTTYFNPAEPISITFQNSWLISSAYGDSNAYLHLVEDYSAGYAPYKYRFVPIFTVRLFHYLLNKIGYITIQHAFILVNILSTLAVGLGFTAYLNKFHSFSKPISLMGGMLAVSSLAITRTVLFPMIEPFSMAVALLLFWSVRSRKPALFVISSILAVTVKEVYIFSAALWFINAPLSKRVFSRENIINLIIAATPILTFMIVRVMMGGAPLEVNYGYNILAGEFPAYGKDLLTSEGRMRLIWNIFLSFGFLWVGAINIGQDQFLKRSYWVCVLLVVMATVLLSAQIARVLGILFPLIIPAFLMFFTNLPVEKPKKSV